MVLIRIGEYRNDVLSELAQVAPGSPGQLTVNIFFIDPANTVNWFVDALLDDGVTFQTLGTGGVIGTGGFYQMPFVTPGNSHAVRVRLQVGGRAILTAGI